MLTIEAQKVKQFRGAEGDQFPGQPGALSRARAGGKGRKKTFPLELRVRRGFSGRARAPGSINPGDLSADVFVLPGFRRGAEEGSRLDALISMIAA